MALMGMVVFAAVGPLRPGWSHRAGTSPALLAQLARRYTVPTSGGSAATPSGRGAAAVPSTPFTDGLSGSVSTTAPDARGEVQATLTMQLQDPSSTPLVVVLDGVADQSGGIAMSSGTVTFGGYHGAVTSLSGNTIGASVATPNPQALTMTVAIDQSANTVSGSVTGVAGR
jgi:hypothetical protein